MDLEEAFLQQNVPGRYSTWSTNDDPQNAESESDSEDDEYYFQDAPSLPVSTDTAAPTAAALKKGGNTGVKGVISDYLDTRREEKLKVATERLERLEILHGMTNPSRIANSENGTTPVEQCQDDDESNDSEDDEFMKEFRLKRLQQLQNNLRPTYGTYSTLTPEEYVSLLDTIDPQTFVVVHLYESTVKESAMLHSALGKVAQKMDHVKFVEVEAYEAKPSLDLICLPIILVYKGGELICNEVRFTDGLVGQRGGGDCLHVEDVKEKLEGLGVDSC